MFFYDQTQIAILNVFGSERRIRAALLWLELSIKELFDRPYIKGPNQTNEKSG